MGNVWVVGSTGALGKAVCDVFAVNGNVIGFSRRRAAAPHVTVDLAIESQTREAFAEAFVRNPPSIVIFCHRFRPAPGIHLSDFDCLKAALDIELRPISIFREIVLSRPTNRVSIFVISSTAGSLSCQADIPIWYQQVKSLLTSTVKLFAMMDRLGGVRWGAVLLGEILKTNLEKYSLEIQDSFNRFSVATFGGQIATADEIARFLLDLSSDSFREVGGRVFTYDRGVSLFASESLLRTPPSR